MRAERRRGFVYYFGDFMKQHLLGMDRTAAGMPCRLTVLAALMAGLCAPALAASDLVISQIYGGGGNSGATYTNDYIEVFNRGASPVDVSNYSVQYGSQTGTTWQVTPLPSMILQPGQYLLVQEAKGSGGSTPLPTPDTSATLALSATSGKVLLSSSVTPMSGAAPSGAALLDLVGFGTPNAAETAAAPGPSNALAIFRAGAGCTDTDNNSADFSTGAPVPHNSASERNVCGAPVTPPIVAVCPANLSVLLGSAGTAALSASDVDGIVNSATITSGAAAGISLGDFVAAPAVGQSATVTLRAAATLAAGSYPVVINFGNDQAQTTSCSVTVNAQPLAGVSHTIPQIQGNGAASPYVNTVQTTEGVVTLKVATGFFIQDVNGDGDPTTSDGLFVYTGTAGNNAVVGDLVRVTGGISEYTPTGAANSYTEMQNVTALVSQGRGPAIVPTNITLPNANLGQVEGMLVHFTSPLTISQSEYVGTRGELTLSSGRLEVPTNRYPARSAEALALAAANAANVIVLDDGIFVTPTVVPYLDADHTRRTGDTVVDLTGVVDFGAIGGGGAAYKLQPTIAPVFSDDNPRAGAPVLVAGNIKVASANVLNFFTTFTNGDDAFGQSGQGCQLGSSNTKSNCRGADSLLEFTRQRDKIVAELKAIDADAVGLMEIQNNGDIAVGYLVDQLNAAYGAVTYAYVPKPPATGTDAIRVAMLYKPSKLNLVGAPLSDADAVNNRPPLAQTFRTNDGAKFSLIVNHLKSKGSCPSGGGADADLGDSQSCWNATRKLQAQRLVGTFVPQVVAAAGDPDVLMIGDFNSYGQEDPIAIITGSGFVNELERFVRPQGMPYSFVFSGTSGYLDHALASATLTGQVVDVAEWHLNADEPSLIDYNLDGKPQDFYTALPYRASDHDPVVVSLNLQPEALDVSASLRVARSGLVANRSTGLFSGTVTLTNTGTTTLSAPFQVELDGLSAGVTLVNASGNHAGAPYVTASAASVPPGASFSVPVSFANPSKVALSYTVKIFSGSF